MEEPNQAPNETPLGQFLGIVAAILLVALIVGQLAFVSGLESERSNLNPPAYASSSKLEAAKTCEDVTDDLQFDCIYEHVEGAFLQENAAENLTTQQGMKFWTSVLAYIAFGTLILTGIALWFIKGTLDATAAMVDETRELTIESIKATEAMVAANQIALSAERPWIQVSVEVYNLSVAGDLIQFDYAVFFENTGRSVAQVYAVRDTTTGIGPVADQYVANQFASFERARDRGENIVWLQPGERYFFRSRSGHHTNYVGWVGMPGFRSTRLLVLLAAHYRREGRGDWFMIERVFACGELARRPDDTMIFEGMGDFTESEISVRPDQYGRTT